CVFCGNAGDVQYYRNKLVCRECALAMAEKAQAKVQAI
ncbi:MAG: AbrB family transcriptional regulator, partial [Bacillota bacterium]